MGVQNVVGFSCDGRTDYVYYRQCFAFKALCLSQRGKSVRRFSALGNYYRKDAFVRDGTAVTEFAGKVRFDGNTAHALDVILADYARMISRPATHNVDFFNVFYVFFG